MRLRIQTNRYFQSIDDFSFIKEIGVGSFGSVKLALHVQTNKCYAVKVVQITKSMTENELLLLERQINLHANIDHPHIIKLWDTLVEQDTIYMIMELAQNGTLFNHQSKHRQISQAETFKFFSQTLSAIHYMHTHDIMHRDIKPENILLDNACNVKICDLGWATDNIHMKRKTFCGTYEYMAPEMVFEQEYNYSIDIWALGILLYQLIHGFAPFSAKNLEQMKEKLKLGYYELGSNFSKDLKNLIIDILQFEAIERPTLQKVMGSTWMERMRKEIRGQIGKIQNQLKGQVSNRAKVDREKGTQIASKKHKRFDSLMNENYIKKEVGAVQHGLADKMGDQQKKNGKKKKCKTQGQESIEKLLTQTGKCIATKPKWKKENMSQVKLTTEMSKTTLTWKKEGGTLSGLKMKRIADKLNQLTNQHPIEKKKTRLKTQKQQLH